ncbi:MAG TPA: hypothetical protein VN419_01060 [Humidesulfovibrio sp.]|uniref:hypothetical protein n=1 Tax=Humidesulfovibrio sp. TaxID=2910988 RepID=UPI002B6A1C45|nr:hypothetical protein [Humidesulfovibrio sp.]HWR02578.1 hypothetical protein [Humidesulfovibrio sp.]
MQAAFSSTDEAAMERETLLTRIVDSLREAERPALRERIESALAEQDSAASELRFLKDLDIFMALPGPAFMYSRGIAETLRVGEDIFELAYVLRRARE